MNNTNRSQTSLSAQRRKLLEAMLKKRGVSLASRRTGFEIAPRPQQTIIPLAYNQQGLWFLDRIDPGKANYNVPGNIRMRGELDVTAMEKALSDIVRRHEALRTVFVADADGEPLQKVIPDWPVTLEMIDLRMLAQPDREQRARELAIASAQHVFDLENGPLWRFSLLQLAEEDYLFCLNLHHIIVDGWAMGILSRELKLHYEACITGRPAEIRPLPIQFGDFAIWQRNLFDRAEGDERLNFWRQHFAEELPQLDLPFDHDRPAKQTFRGGHAAVEIPKSSSEAMRQQALREGASPYMFLLSSFYVVLHFFSKQSDIIVGSTFANRQTPDLERLIGFFANTLPVRIQLRDEATFRELLQAVRETVLQTSMHQDMPLSKLVQELQPRRTAGRNPFYDVVFDLLTPDRNPAIFGYGLSSVVKERMHMAGVEMTPMDIEGGNARFDLAVFIWDQSDGFAGTFEYCSDLFEHDTIEKMVGTFTALLDLVVAQPEITLHALTEKLATVGQKKQELLESALKSSLHQKLKMTKRRAVQV